MTGKRVLLVEGVDDEHVIKNLCGFYKLPHLSEIAEHQGYTRLLEALPIRLQESDVEALGVVIDADMDLAARWRAIRDRLRAAGYGATPEKPAPGGLILEAPLQTLLPRVGVWLMPDNQLPGILEDFIRLLVPADDALFAYAEKCIKEIPPGQRRFTELALPKAEIHTWLAWQDEPGRPLGQSITRRALDANAPAARLFIGWLKALYFTV